MKRFYCTICNRVKRVRKYPNDVVTPEAESPESRKGTCTRHNLNTRTTIRRNQSNQKVGV